MARVKMAGSEGLLDVTMHIEITDNGKRRCRVEEVMGALQGQVHDTFPIQSALDNDANVDPMMEGFTVLRSSS